MSPTPGRNDPCWCGSGKKYKHCHMKQDQQEAKKPIVPSPVPADEPRPPKVQSLAPMQNEPPARSPEEIAADAQAEAEWKQFKQADVDGKVAMFLEKLDSRHLDAEDSFEMLLQIRDQSNIHRNAAARVRFAELIERLRRELPDAYQHDQGFYLEDLIKDAISDQNRSALPELLGEFVQVLPKAIDEFFRIVYPLLYHGQNDPLFNAMNAAWSKINAADNDILSWGGEEFGDVLMELALYRYLETTPSPRPDDPALVNALSVYMKPNAKWYETAVRHLSAPAPSPWRREDFGESVDAEQWEDNVAALLFEFMADQRRRANVPFSKSALMNQRLHQVLHQQFSEGPAKSRKPRGKSKQKHAPSAPVSSLIPQYKTCDRALVSDFQILGSHPYQAGALMDLLPAYLHFAARLGLIHPTEMDQAFDDLHPLAALMPKLLGSYGGDIHLVHVVETSWLDTTLDIFRHDPDLEAARAQPLVIAPPTPTSTITPQTFTFKVVYRPEPNAWFVIEMRADQTLHDLHHAILDAADFDEDHLYSFYMSGQAWDKAAEYSRGPDARHSSNERISNLPLRMKQRFLYLYDYGDQHEFDVQIIAASADTPRGRYPKIVERHGKMPPQYPDWDEEDLDSDEDEWEDENDDEET
jgi:hypothetical protein